MFQPTRPHGARQPVNMEQVHDIFVSTHAPAWGATALGDALTHDIKFQPTRPHGARLCGKNKRQWFPKFQPTRPHGARPFYLE